MKVFIVGGTGLLGSAAAAELITRGHSVSSIALPLVPPGAVLPKEMKIVYGDINKMPDEEVIKLFKGFDGFVFAAGVDERVEFHPPVYEKYEKYNIQPVKRLFKLAKDCGIKHTVVLNSYFSHFAKIWPKLKMTEYHPYVRSRIEQEIAALSFAGDDMSVAVLELPYIFGTMPGRKPVWTLITDVVKSMPRTLFYPKGGTTMVTVNQVAQCIAGALEKGKTGCYPVGMYNMEWKDMMRIVCKAMGQPNKKIVSVPKFLFTFGVRGMLKEYKRKNIEPGLNPKKFANVMCALTYIDGALIRKEFGVKDDDIEAAIIDSITRSLKVQSSEEQAIEMVCE